MQNRQEKSSRNGGNHHESKQKWDIYYNTLPDPKSQGVITMDQEIRRLMPEEMTASQQRISCIESALEAQQIRLFALKEEYEDIREDLDGKRYLDVDVRETVYNGYIQKIQNAHNEIRDLTIALNEARQAS